MSNTTALRSRDFTPTDREACLAIFDGNLGKYFALHERDEFARWLDKRDRQPYQVVELAGEIVACGGIYFDSDKDHVGLAWGMVRRDLHRQGIGRWLTELRLRQMTDLFPNKSQRLGTSQHTFEFYQRMGFKVTNVTPGGFGPGIDRYDMERS